MSEEKSIDFKIRGILKEVLPVQEISRNGERFNPESASAYLQQIAAGHTRTSYPGILLNNYNKDHYMQPDMVGVITYKGEKIKIAGWVELDHRGGKKVRISAYDPKNERKQPKKVKEKGSIDDIFSKNASLSKLFD